jgi:hypothetical protein
MWRAEITQARMGLSSDMLGPRDVIPIFSRS